MDDKKKPKTADRTSSQPHYYGKEDGVHLFHATDEAHQELIGEHLHSPSNSQLNAAIKRAKDSKKGAVVIHGTPPKMLMGKVELKKSETALRPSKTSVEPVLLAKAYLHSDNQTRTDLPTHLQSLSNARKDFMQWGQQHLVPMQKDDFKALEFFDCTLKVRKYDADLYNGWVENSTGTKIHQFERVTLPELMIQLESKLELYGSDLIVPQPEDASEDHSPEAIVRRAHSHISRVLGASISKEHVNLDAILSSSILPKAEKKLKELRAKLKAQAMAPKALEPVTSGETKVVLPSRQLFTNLSGEDSCEDCGSRKAHCECYSGLPAPRIQIDLKAKSLTVFFKTEWGEEDREAYIEDVRRRIGAAVLKKVSRF